MNPQARKILVIDDDQDLLKALGTRLRAEGFAFVAASDGVMAVAAARREKPDLILLDLGLPGGDGYQVLERIKTLTPTSMTPVIVLSAKDPKVHEEKSRAAGADAFIQKPAESAALLAEIRRLLGES
jgi:two-component system KDP operon response regulator KdpE